MTGPLGEVQVGNVFVLVRDGYQYNTTFYSGICLMEDLRSTSPSSPQDASRSGQPVPLRKGRSLPDSLSLCIHDIPDEGVLDEKAASC